MSTTNALELSTASGEPVELYLFQYGAGVTNRFAITDSDFPVESDGITYQPDYVERGEVNTSGTLDKTELVVTVRDESSLSQLFTVSPPGSQVSLTIYRCHVDPEGGATIPLAIWAGRVLAHSVQDGQLAELRCEPASTSMRRIGLRRHYQYMCPHVLYGPGCKADRYAHSVRVQAVATSSRSVTLSGDYSAHYGNGVVAWTPIGQKEEVRSITGISYDSTTNTTELTLSGRTRALSDGLELTVSKGCAHDLDDCASTFDNAVNYGGQPWIPTENPHGTTSIYN